MSKDKASVSDWPSEWAVLIEAQTITSAGAKMKIEADEEARKALTKRLGLTSLDSLSVDFKIRRDTGSGSVHVRGKFTAEVTQACVITGEPVKDTVKEDFEAWFADKTQALSFARARHDKIKKTGGAEMPLLDENEDPEAMIDGKVDVGELAVQYLSLAINPYPHCEGATLPEVVKPKEDAESPYKNPFAALKDWKDKLDGKND
ncbi:MAG: YceD family protein [Alphaproteobacteria bacterium]